MSEMIAKCSKTIIPTLQLQSYMDYLLDKRSNIEHYWAFNY